MFLLQRTAALTGFASLARSVGLNPGRLADAAGIPREALANPELRIPASRIARLLELAAREADVEDFGIRLGETRRLSNLGLMGVIIGAAPTPRRAIEAMARYVRLHGDALSLRVERLDRGWFVGPSVFVPRLDRVRQITELTLTVAYRAFGETFGQAWQPELVCFPHPAPQDVSSHRRVFGPCLQFDAVMPGFVCSDALMGRTRVAEESLLLREARGELDKRLALLDLGAAARVRETIAWLLPTGLCSADVVAARLGFDRRTLHRRLAAEEQCYATLLDEVRRDLARQQLANARRSLKEVAAALGFEAPSAFSRWFRARFGCSASEWSRHNAEHNLHTDEERNSQSA